MSRCAALPPFTLHKLTSHFRFIYMKCAQLGPRMDRVLLVDKADAYETSCYYFATLPFPAGM